MLIFNILTILSLGLMIGVEFAVSVFIDPILSRLDSRTRAQAVQMFATRLGRAMPFWYGINLLLLIAEAILHRHQPGLSLVITAAVIWATIILLTILFLVPINNRMMQLDGTAFSEAHQREHRRWTNLHHIRVLTLVLATVCLLIALPI
jgi:uncharacterized membrane protein